MTQSRLDPDAPLPSPGALFRSTLIAAVVAGLLLVTVVLPAEYGIDPTGAGKLLGLTRMGEIKVSLANEVAAAEPLAEAKVAVPEPVAEEPITAPPASEHVTDIVLAPNEGKEVKLVMHKDGRATFSWSTDGGVVNYDMHADAPGIKYHGYGKGFGTSSESGELVAAFDGSHGWFWRNRGKESITVTLRTSGEYQELKRL